MIKVLAIEPEELHWPFETQGQPYLMYPSGSYPMRLVVDPFPAYPHDRAMVEVLARSVDHFWPVPWLVQFVILPFENVTRSNGSADTQPCKYQDGAYKTWQTNITLSAKRIPIHPAVTRYLVAHEYGHAVEEAIQHARGLKVNSDQLMDEYRELRGLPADGVYGGGRWHLQACEIFANDWRILIADVEPEHWPHPGVARPEDVPVLREWWARTRTETERAEELKGDAAIPAAAAAEVVAG